MDLLHIGLYLLFLIFFLISSLYTWLYLRRTKQSKQLIGISPPPLPMALVQTSLYLSVALAVLVVVFVIVALVVAT